MKNMVYILVANIVFLLVSVFNGFIVPKFLSVEEFSVLKTFTFYISYSGLLSLGYADGTYLRYGGANLAKIDSKELADDYKNYILLEGMISVVFLFVGIITADFMLISFAFGFFLTNIVMYYNNLYQAVGEYNLYGKSINCQVIFLAIINIILLFIFDIKEANIYIVFQILSLLLSVIYLTYVLNKKINILRFGEVNVKHLKDNLSSGFVLLLGNFSNSIFTGIDRWFIKFLMESRHFAYYSFAVSLDNILNIFTAPITVALYNNFCHNNSVEYLINIKQKILLWSMLIVSLFYPIKFIILYFLPKYESSLLVMMILSSTQIFSTIIKGIYVNLYKANKEQKKYFKVVLQMILVSIIFNSVLYLICRTMETFAAATLCTNIVWFVYCEYNNKAIRYNLREYLVIVVLMILYFTLGLMCTPVIGFLMYLLGYIFVAKMFMSMILKESINEILLYITSVRKRFCIK